MSRSARVPASLFDSRRHGFAEVTVVPTPFGDAVHVSGQVAWDAERPDNTLPKEYLPTKP